MSWEDAEILGELLVVVVFLIDLCGFIDTLKGWLSRWLGVRGPITLRPFDCSLCMYHHTAVIVMLCLGRLSLEVYTAICVGSLLTSTARTFFCVILDDLSIVLGWLSIRH